MQSWLLHYVLDATLQPCVFEAAQPPYVFDATLMRSRLQPYVLDATLVCLRLQPYVLDATFVRSRLQPYVATVSRP